MGEGLGSLPKTQRFVYGSGWVVCGGWCSARLLGGMRGLVFRPGFLRLMLPETHTTQPTGLGHSNQRVGWVLGICNV